VGRSDWPRDWNYAQTSYRTGTNAAQSEAWPWRIHFGLTNLPPGNATLTLAFASAQRAGVKVYVNDDRQLFATVTPAVQGGNALLREGIHAKYCVEHVSIPTARLRLGDNVIALVFPASRAEDAHVMYDYLNLELP
jgi:rhamnogalacturonan endolyase